MKHIKNASKSEEKKVQIYKNLFAVTDLENLEGKRFAERNDISLQALAGMISQAKKQSGNPPKDDGAWLS